jgi:Serine acetyltransferase, N-terminal
LASHLHSSIIGHNSLESSLAFILANKLSSPTLLATNVMQTILKAYAADPVCLSVQLPAATLANMLRKYPSGRPLALWHLS